MDEITVWMLNISKSPNGTIRINGCKPGSGLARLQRGGWNDLKFDSNLHILAVFTLNLFTTI
jgi:hypothetical protein